MLLFRFKNHVECIELYRIKPENGHKTVSLKKLETEDHCDFNLLSNSEKQRKSGRNANVIQL